MKIGLARLGNSFYNRAPALYGPLFSLYKSISDRKERALFSSWLKPGDVVLDIGANIGAYSSFFADLVGPNGKVFAFEPEMRNGARLKRALRTRPQAEVVNAAVLDRTGPLKLFISHDLNVDHRTYDTGDNRLSVDVPGVALDDYLPAGTRVDAIKLDIQGAELAALRGAQRVLRDNQRLLVVLEYWPFGISRAGERPAHVIEFLQALGFRVSTVEGGAIPSLDSTEFNSYVNLLAIKQP